MAMNKAYLVNAIASGVEEITEITARAVMKANLNLCISDQELSCICAALTSWSSNGKAYVENIKKMFHTKSKVSEQEKIKQLRTMDNEIKTYLRKLRKFENGLNMFGKQRIRKSMDTAEIRKLIRAHSL